MIISLLTDPSVTNKKNFVEGYNVLTGEVENHPAKNKYGEVHTGDAWLPAKDRYCHNKQDLHACWIDCIWRQVAHRSTRSTVTDSNYIHTGAL